LLFQAFLKKLTDSDACGSLECLEAPYDNLEGRIMNEPEIKEIEQVWKIDPLLNGSTLKKIRYGKSRDLSVRITMPDGKTFEFSQLEDFNRWLAWRTQAS